MLAGDAASGPRVLAIDDRDRPCVHDLAQCAVLHSVVDLEAALAALPSARPDIVFIHAGLDAAGTPGAAVNAGAEIRRLWRGANLVVHGAPSTVDAVTELAQRGIAVRFLPEPVSPAQLEVLATAAAEERRARAEARAMAAAFVPGAASRLRGIGLSSFAEQVENRIIYSALQQLGGVPGAAPSLKMFEGGLRARCLKLGIHLRELPPRPRRSLRDRILVIGELTTSRALCEALADPPCAVVSLPAGKLHASCESRAGAVVAVVEVATFDAVVDAWALRRAAPSIPLLLHGRPGPGVAQLLRVLDLASEAVAPDTEAVHQFVGVLLQIGAAISAADRACASAGGIGLAGVAPVPIDMRKKLRLLEHLLCVQAVAETGSQTAAAKLLGISRPALNKRLHWT